MGTTIRTRVKRKMREMKVLVIVAWTLLMATSALSAASAAQVVPKPPASPSLNSPSHQGFYTNSRAVLIGINNYQMWPRLHFAVSDAKSVRQKFIELEFEEGKIIELYDLNATKENILRIVADELPRKTGENDGMLFFFAGHGQTEELHGGIKRGLLIPVRGDINNLYAKRIPMNVMADIS